MADVLVKLTDAEKAVAKSYIDKWNGYAMSTEQANRAECEEAIAQLYKNANLPVPSTIEWVESPGKGLEKVLGTKSVEGAWKSLNQTCNAISIACVWSKLDKLPYDVKSIDKWQRNFGVQDDFEFWRNVGRPLREKWWTDVTKYDVQEIIAGAPYSGSVFCDIWSFIDFLYNERKEESLESAVPFLTLARNLKNFWITGDAVFLLENPIHLEVDDRGVFHSGEGMAVEYRDGYGFYAWHGIIIEDARIIRHPELLTVEEIEGERNAEMRRIMLERYGWDKFLINSKAEVLDAGERGTLYRKEMPPPEEEIRMLRVTNSTPEPDGTFKDYWLRVPPTTKTAQEAVAWSFSMNEKDYAPLAES